MYSFPYVVYSGITPVCRNTADFAKALAVFNKYHQMGREVRLYDINHSIWNERFKYDPAKEETETNG